MSTNPNKGRQPDSADSYGGYSGYTPSNAADDPYGAYASPGATPQSATSDPSYAYGQQSQQQASYGQQSQQNSQQQAYQPPESVTRRRGRNSFSNTIGQISSQRSPIDKEDRKFALLSYLGLCFTGIFFFFAKSKRPFVRFNAAQSVLLFTPLIAALAILKIIGFVVGILAFLPLVGPLLVGLVALLQFLVVAPTVVLWLFLMVQAYRGVRVKLPIVGDYAERFAARK